MKKENLMQYVLIVLIAFIAVIGLINLFKTSSSLKIAQKALDSASQKVDSSISLIKDQGIIIDSIRNSNARLLDDMEEMENGYKEITGTITRRFRTTFIYLDSIENKFNSLTKKRPNVE